MQSDLQKIEELAALFLTVDEIAIAIDIEPAELRREIRGGKSKRAHAYQKGKMKSTIELRQLTLELAKKGSPQADAAMLEFAKQQDLSENYG